MENSKLIPGNPHECKCHTSCPDCEYLLQCSEVDDAWTGDSIEEVRTLAFVSALIQTSDVSKEAEPSFLQIFQTRICAELGKCTPENIEWAKAGLYKRRQKVEELELKFSEEVDKLPGAGDVDLIHEYAAKLDRFCGELMTKEEFFDTFNQTLIEKGDPNG